MPSTDLPSPAELLVRSEWPDPLAMFDGRRVGSREMWERERKPELRALFQNYMYGCMPAALKVKATVSRTDTKALGGKATLKEVSLAYGPEGCPPLELLLVVPNKSSRPAPVFLGLNFTGNHTLLPDPEIKIPTAWMRQREGVEDHHATPKGRGLNVETWALEQSIDAGFAVATLVYPLARSLQRTDTPSRLWLVLATLPLIIDFALGYFSIWENTHLSRFLTGALLSSAAVFYIMPGLIDLSSAIARRFGRE